MFFLIALFYLGRFAVILCAFLPQTVYTAVCLGTQVPVFEMGTDVKPAEIAKQGLAKARAEDFDAIIVDTAGRLQVCHTMPVLCRKTMGIKLASMHLVGANLSS